MADGLFSYPTQKGQLFGVRLKYKREDGQWRRKTWKGFLTKRDATVFLQARRLERYEQDRFPERAPSESFDETCRQYLPLITHKKTWKEETRFYLWWVKFLGNILTRDISLDRLHEARMALLESKKSNATVNRYVHWIRHVLNVAKDRGIITINQAARLKSLPEPPAPTLYLSNQQEHALKHAMGKWFPYARFALLTGMRSGEQFNLKWQDVDLQAGVAILHRTKSGRTVLKPLTEEAKAILKKLPQTEERVFPVSVNTWYKWFRKWREAAKLPPGFTWHTLRHTTGSRLGMKGATSLEIGQLLGHTTPRMSERYTHFGQEHLRRILEKAGS